ncbi:MAG: CIA30 family protein [bacterium]|nr:CIA30 family protein [bacterium]
MKRFILCLVAVFLAGNGYAVVVDDFEDGDYSNPEWWVFDKIEPRVVKNEAGDKRRGKYFLEITGDVQGWYSGGMGMYVADKVDCAAAGSMLLDVYGYGKDSGQIKIEIVDDDNFNWECEQDDNYKLVNDDQFVYQFPVNWEGWKTVEIPFSKFKDSNPGIGDDEFNPEKADGSSGGLLQFNIIFIGSKSSGNVRLKIDNIAFE